MFETYITPRAARNKNLEWRYIINSSENVTLRQVAVVVVCHHLIIIPKLSPLRWCGLVSVSALAHVMVWVTRLSPQVT